MTARTCSIDDCTRAHLARGWCPRHYEQWRRHGDPLAASRRWQGWPLAKRLWSRATADGTGCWIWHGPKGKGEYGVISQNNRTASVHRVAYELVKGPIPDGLTIDHLCRTTLCINPDHLEAVTLRENILRGTSPSAVNARKTHCNRGHLFDEENTARWDNSRVCRQCRQEWDLTRRP